VRTHRLFVVIHYLPRVEKKIGGFVCFVLVLVLKQYYLLNIVETCIYKGYPVKMARTVPSVSKTYHLW
jgi:hypothetical protein